MILHSAKKIIFLNAGHSLSDSGAALNGFKEFIETMEIRDRTAPLLKAAGFEVQAVPDELGLRGSIAWVNQRAVALNDGLAIDIHLNSGPPAARGAEAFYGQTATSVNSRNIAAVMAREVAQSLGIPNRGAKPDTVSFIGSLGWVRQINCWSVLLEVCFLSSREDMAILKASGGYDRAAEGIVNACKIIFGMTKDPRIPLMKKIIALMTQLIQLLKIRR